MAKTELKKNSADQDRKVTASISYLSCPGFKLLSWILQCFGHIQSKNEDAKSAVSCVVVVVVVLFQKHSNGHK